MSGKVHEATLVEREEIASSIDRLVFRPSDGPLTFRAGQFVSIRVGIDQDGAVILRSYSIASASGAPHFTLIVKRVPGGTASKFFESLELGARIQLTGPMGFFVLELAHAGDLVFGATGVGIAPVLPMIEEALARPETGRVHLLWGNRHRAELFWQDEVGRLAQHPRLSTRLFLSGDSEVLEPSASGIPIAAGRITAPMLALAQGLAKPTFYLVGSGSMIREAKPGLVAAGIDRKRQIRNEAFFD